MLGTSRILTLVFTDLADSTGLKTRRGIATRPYARRASSEGERTCTACGHTRSVVTLLGCWLFGWGANRT